MDGWMFSFLKKTTPWNFFMLFHCCAPYVHLLLSLDPVIVKKAEPGVQLKALLIAAKTDCVLVGDSDGQVTVYKIQNLKVGQSDPVSLRGTRFSAVVHSRPSEQLEVNSLVCQH